MFYNSHKVLGKIQSSWNSHTASRSVKWYRDGNSHLVIASNT